MARRFDFAPVIGIAFLRRGSNFKQYESLPSNWRSGVPFSTCGTGPYRRPHREFGSHEVPQVRHRRCRARSWCRTTRHHLVAHSVHWSPCETLQGADAIPVRRDSHRHLSLQLLRGRLLAGHSVAEPVTSFHPATDHLALPHLRPAFADRLEMLPEMRELGRLAPHPIHQRSTARFSVTVSMLSNVL